MSQEPQPANYREIENSNKIASLEANLKSFKETADRDIQELKKDNKEIRNFISEIKGMSKFVWPLWLAAITFFGIFLKSFFGTE